MSVLLPLFPLDVVLFPGETLPLHIFEDRYREMIAELLESKQPFGVVRALENGVADVGCSAEITSVAKRYEDGRLDIITEGRNRFELLHLDQQRAFLRGQVDFFADEPGRPGADKIQRLLQLHGDLLQVLDAEGAPPDADSPVLSFELAAALPFALDFKQTLLGLRSEAGRVDALIQYYENVMPEVARAVRARKKAGSNGHGR
ncbi:MAG TPA: LON peptidase substrate-binding domain-containing protein [Terriglobales bacterium]|nr:LON peptidase substrate-binding domain-containing protein [Terriglobales bacterium]